ncbi:hypothetical protein WJX81_006679 [Elliptochloris bilobata]|uniref:Uncharacterized protein n=1 Tax=Elliptochloris bilobata TaxID=381761 RepID=A0AAW1RQF7_9CHLO
MVEVLVSGRLADSPCILVTYTFGWPTQRERIITSQALVQIQGDAGAAEYMKGCKMLEVHTDHPIIAALQYKVAGGAED